MDSQELSLILKSQADLCRTKDGWDLGKNMPEASLASVSAMSEEDFLVKECLNCQLILSAEYFVAGCPNCGCKDHETLQVRR